MNEQILETVEYLNSLIIRIFKGEINQEKMKEILTKIKDILKWILQIKKQTFKITIFQM